MKYLSLLLILSSALWLTACENSKYTRGQDTVTTTPLGDDVTPFSPGDPNNPTYLSNHCSDITGQEYEFYGYMKNVLNKGSYQSLIESQTNCSSYNGRVKYYFGQSNFTYYQYEKHLGTANCNWWSQQPMGITVKFFRSHPTTASIAIDATGNGWAAQGGQGFPVKRMVFDGQQGGQIDCSAEDLTIYSRTAYGDLVIQVEKEYGNKNAHSMRANVYFNGAKLGTQQLRRLQ